VNRFQFIDAEKAHYPITLLCRVLDVSRPGYHAWRKRPRSARAVHDDALTAAIRTSHAHSRGTYGVPRIHADLQAQGHAAGYKRVRRLMRGAGLSGCRRGRRVRTTLSDPAAVPAPNLVQRQFQAAAPNQLWVGDITYLPTSEGWQYLAVLLDVYSRRVVGWAFADHLRTDLTLEALQMALQRRRPPAGLVHHTDRGSQYTAERYQQLLSQQGITCSMSRRGQCLDNAMAESFFATLKTELVARVRWLNGQEARRAIFEYLEVFYNRQRRHSALGYQSPVLFEQQRRMAEAV
jgi:transposase InsO family protein